MCSHPSVATAGTAAIDLRLRGVALQVPAHPHHLAICPDIVHMSICVGVSMTMHAAIASRPTLTGARTTPTRQLQQARQNGAAVSPLHRSMQRGRQHQLASARSASSVTDWVEALPSLVQDLKGQDTAAQYKAAFTIASLAFNPTVLEELTSHLLASGVVTALSQALNNTEWNVKAGAALSPAVLTSSSPRIAAAVIARETVPALVDLLKKLDSITDKEWWELLAKPAGRSSAYRTSVQSEVACILGAIAGQQGSSAGISVDIVPLLVPLLSVEDKENRLRISVATALGELAGSDRTLCDAVMAAGTTEALAETLYDKDDRVVIAVAQAMGRIALCGQDIRDAMEAEGSFDTLMRVAARTTRKQNALMKATVPWGIERLVHDAPNY